MEKTKPSFFPRDENILWQKLEVNKFIPSNIYKMYFSLKLFGFSEFSNFIKSSLFITPDSSGFADFLRYPFSPPCSKMAAYRNIIESKS